MLFRSVLAWVNGWRKLPHLTREMEALFAYPQQFAEDVYARIETALRRRGNASGTVAPPRTGRLVAASADGPAASDLPRHFIRSSDQALVAAQHAEAYDEAQLLRDRREGKFLVSCQTSGGWVGVTKSVIDDVLGTGQDARVAGLPPSVAEALALLCPRLH